MRVIACAPVGQSGRRSHMPTLQGAEPAKNRMLYDEQRPITHRWPWRGLAFASDLGSIGYLLKKPTLGTLGWLIALPYYAYAIATKPSGRDKKNECIYQAFANGLFPFLEAKLGIHLGKLLSNGLSKKAAYPIKPTTTGLLGGIASVAILTPFAGDPLTQRLLNHRSQ